MTRFMPAVVTSLVLVLSLASACSKKHAETTPPAGGDTAAAPDKSLYERLGGLPAITAVVDEFLANVLGDDRIAARFANDVTDKEALAHFRQMLIDQICAATGGPCKYTGKTMVEAHKGQNVTDAEFTALVEDLAKALDKFKVPEKEKRELLGALGGMKADIVGK